MTEEMIGRTIPGFSLKDQNEDDIDITSFKGKKVLLSFHPLAWTGICADQMMSLENNHERFMKLNTVPLGINVDSVPSKKAWADSLNITRTSLLSDFWPHGGVAKEFDAFIEDLGFSGRVNIIIDEDGKIEFFRNYDLGTLPDIEEILEYLSS